MKRREDKEERGRGRGGGGIILSSLPAHLCANVLASSQPYFTSTEIRCTIADTTYSPTWNMGHADVMGNMIVDNGCIFYCNE